ncbi:hypothetical protein HRR83_004324 [Exophiala dermatitidis]|nr:hypothetical protein HRR73_006213 [Exophiala dermatitidis]KAJ4517714.1 hypothetical protein HRR75_002932 [Exophiala dermatitidis]KAJ4521371.1 hypothetical protein HRR74_003194 [Exophiala dermatitidis]KAJ4542042.1 hypothetical protein HRR77_005930 [Exophiala dermatitidis]KAJ4544808.1 hypothetical protein HRR76_002847 [Exophiala dermatitidis]
MTIHKQYPPRDYETFADDTPAESDRLVANPPTSISQQQSDSDKSRSAAFEAQRLASQGSWADTFVGGSGTPATNPTPAASTVDDCEEARKAQYSSSHSHILQEPNDTLDPPPIYTPSDTTVSSPLMARSEPPPLPMPAYAYEPEQKPKAGDAFPSDSSPTNSSWPPEKREHREHETSRSIRGTYQLYDLLDLSTTSGSIFVTIEVQPGDKPSVLRLASKSGSVRVRMVTGGGLFRKPTVVPKAAQERILQTDISTHSGSVIGNVIVGNGGSLRIDTHSASVSVDVFTFGVSEHHAPSNISTSTQSGSQNIQVIAPSGSTEAVRAIDASHTVLGSGSMNIHYPSKWEGTVHILQQGSGYISASGDGLLVRKESGREIFGYKGQKEGRKIEIFEQGSGSVRFRC